MVGFRGQFGVWTDNETSFVDSAAPSVPLEIRTPGVWTGTDYYDPAYARAMSRQTYLATQNLLGDAALANLYAADPNPLGHSAGNVLAGVTGGYFGGPAGSAVAVTAWETLYSTALGEPIETALTQGVVAGVTNYAFGKAFDAGAAVIGAGVKRAAGSWIARIAAKAAANDVSSIASAEESSAIRGLLYGGRVGENLPGSEGVALPGRPSAQELANLSAKHDVEFAVTYRLGPGKNGGGGQYFLFSGTRGQVTIPIGPNIIFIAHTHPGGTAFASPADLRVLARLRLLGSSQRSSVVIPVGKNPVRYGGQYGAGQP